MGIVSGYVATISLIDVPRIMGWSGIVFGLIGAIFTVLSLKGVSL
jgi:hypothetical protein